MAVSNEANEALSLLWRATWQSTVLAVLVAGVIVASRRWLAAKWRVVLWALPLFRLLFLVVPASGLSVFNGVTYLTAPRESLPTTSLQETEPSAFADRTDEASNVEWNRQGLRVAALPFEPHAVPATTVPVATDANAGELTANQWNVATAVFVLWLLGCAAMALRWACSTTALRQALARCEPLERELWEQLKPSSIISSPDGGTTSMAYGIRGYPSLLIIDREGKIAFNSGIEPKDRSVFMQEMNELARSNGIPWPPNENAPQSEQVESMSKLIQAMFSREIDRVLE